MSRRSVQSKRTISILVVLSDDDDQDVILKPIIKMKSKGRTKKRTKGNVESMETEEEDEYEVEAILNERVQGRKRFFELKWKGFQETTWEPEGFLTNCRELLQDWETRKRDLGNQMKEMSRKENDSNENAMEIENDENNQNSESPTKKKQRVFSTAENTSLLVRNCDDEHETEVKKPHQNEHSSLKQNNHPLRPESSNTVSSFSASSSSSSFYASSSSSSSRFCPSFILPADDSNDISNEVEKILDCRLEGDRRFFYVKWKGLRDDCNTWESQDNLEGSPVLLAYMQK